MSCACHVTEYQYITLLHSINGQLNSFPKTHVRAGAYHNMLFTDNTPGSHWPHSGGTGVLSQQNPPHQLPVLGSQAVG